MRETHECIGVPMSRSHVPIRTKIFRVLSVLAVQIQNTIRNTVFQQIDIDERHLYFTEARMEPEKIATEIRKLSLPQKLILAQDIWDSIALERGNLPMPEWQKSELERRYSQYKQGKLKLHEWREVHEELRGAY